MTCTAVLYSRVKLEPNCTRLTTMLGLFNKKQTLFTRHPEASGIHDKK